MQHFKSFESLLGKHELVFELINRPSLKITVTLDPAFRIETIDNPNNLRFPYSIGQRLNQSHKIWACHNNYTINGESACEDEKIFGIRKKDIPKDHPLRIMYPSKFK